MPLVDKLEIIFGTISFKCGIDFTRIDVSTVASGLELSSAVAIGNFSAPRKCGAQIEGTRILLEQSLKQLLLYDALLNNNEIKLKFTFSN